MAVNQFCAIHSLVRHERNGLVNFQRCVDLYVSLIALCFWAGCVSGALLVHVSWPTFSTAVLTCVHGATPTPPPPSMLRWLVCFVAVIVRHQAAFLARHPFPLC
jgi:hypothetical protein